MGPQGILELETGLQPSSPFYFGERMAAALPRYLKPHEPDRCLLVTGPKLMDLHGAGLLRAIEGAGIPTRVVLTDEAEAGKRWKTLRRLCERFTSLGATKDTVVISIGGGVVGNLTGLAAALTYRGIRFVEVPTTVMAMTDGSLSNKQAINGRAGKNQFGVYYAPLFVWADAAYPETEPRRQQRSGVVEGIKNVLVGDETLDEAERILAEWRRRSALSELLLRLIRSKLKILDRDPSERRGAVALEYGHTFGHAIEWGMRGELFHGEAVAIGMCLAAELSRELGHASREFLHEHYRIIGEELGAPTRLPAGLAPGRLYRIMRGDNKRTGRGLRFLLLAACGRVIDPDGDYMISADRSAVLSVLGRSGRRQREVSRHA